jgi:hypothetical protein
MRLIVPILVVLFASILAPSVGYAQAEGLEVVQPDNVLFTIADGKSKTVSVWVSNATSESVAPEFDLAVEDGDGKALNGLTVVAEDPKPVGPSSVGRYRLSVQGVNSDTKASGRLVVRKDGVPPGSVTVSIGPEPNLVAGADDPLVIAAVIAGILFVIGLAIARGTTDLTRPIPTVGFDFGKSVATTLTAVGGVFGTVLGASVVPAETSTLSKAAFTALSVLFVVAIAIAAVLPSVSQANDGSKTRLGLFWVAAIVTTWAVFGQLYTLWLLLGELGAQQGFSGAGLTLFKGLLVVGAVAMLYYVPVRIAKVVKLTETDADAGAAGALFGAAAEARTPLL